MQQTAGTWMVSKPAFDWDAAEVRRAIRLICSHPSSITDTQATARSLRLVWDIAQRRGAPTDIFQLPGTMPLVTIGNGPILLVTHLDDPHPLAQVEDGGPPSISVDVVNVPGITRKAGVLATLGAFLGDKAMANQVTLVIEADRHQGSPTFGHWIDGTDHDFTAALYDVADLPIPAPAIFLAATGTVSLRISLRRNGGAVERQYGGVQPDLGHLLTAAIASLKSVDGEVLVPDFYDDVMTPDPEGLDALERIAPSVGRWLTRGVEAMADQLSDSHLTLGAFMAPSLDVRAFSVESNGPYLSKSASAIIEAQIMPGQNASTIARSIASTLESRLPDVTVETLLLRQPARAAFDSDALAGIATVLPIAPGPSPAGLLAMSGIPTLGFSTTWRDPDADLESVSLTSITRGSQTIQQLATETMRLIATPE